MTGTYENAHICTYVYMYVCKCTKTNNCLDLFNYIPLFSVSSTK